MLSQFIKRLKAPVFEDEEKTRVAGTLNVILLAVFALITLWLFIVPFVSANPMAAFISLGVMLLFTTTALISLHRGYVQTTSIFFVSASWLLVTVASYFFGGLNNPGIHAYILIVLIAGLLLGGRVAIGVAAISTVSGLIIYYLHITNLLPASVIVHTLFENWLVLTINVVIAAVLLYLTTTSIQSALNRARREIIERKQVEAIRVKLEEQLLQSQKMEAIGTLTGGIAHDFNNMLTTIIGHTEFALDTLPAENPVYKDLKNIRKVSDRAANLVRQLLTFAREQTSEATLFNLNMVIEDTKEMIERLVGGNITVQFSLAPQPENIRANRHQLEQVLMSLVMNARDALPLGGTITITTSNITLTYDDTQTPTELKPGKYVLLTVSDNGAGMSKEVQSHIFEPFFTTKEVGQGVGLGLSTSFGIVKQGKGHIQVESALDQGTTVRIYLPQADELDDKQRPLEPLVPQSKIILFIEDDPSLRYIITRILSHHGYEVIEASNGIDALEIIQKRAPTIDLLITDMMLPKIGGVELSEKLKVMQPDIKVIFTSGLTPNHFSQYNLFAPGSTFLQKPFSPHTLIEMVKELLGGD